MNMVLDEAKETLVDEDGNHSTRHLGLTILRSTLIMMIAPAEGAEMLDQHTFKEREDERAMEKEKDKGMMID